MGLSDYVDVLRARWRIVVATLLVVLAGAAAVTVMTEPTYRSQADLFVATDAGSTAAELAQGSNFTQQRVQSYAELVTTPRVLEPVAEELGIAGGVAALRNQVSAATQTGSVLLQVAAADASPEAAAAIVNAAAQSLVTVIEDLESTAEGQASPVRVSVVQPGEVPSSPVSPNVARTLLLGAVLGLLLGIGLAILRETLDTQVRDEQDVNDVTDVGVLARFALDDDAPRRPLVVHSDTHSARAEEFRKLRTNLQFVEAARGIRSLTITSALPGEGKSLTAANLAITMAEAGNRVCLVEADLRRPRIAHYLGLDGSVGLTTVLTGQAALEDVVQPWGDGRLSVLLTGALPPNPSELLSSAGMTELIATVEKQYDMVVVDAPPLLPVTDGAVLSKLTGGALIIACAGRVRRDELEHALRNLDDIGASPLGVVLNGLQTKGPQAGRYYQTEYRPLERHHPAPAGAKRAAERSAGHTAAGPVNPRRGRRREPRRAKAG